MAFFWRENQLYTKQGPIDDKDVGWTTFLMDTRELVEVNIHSHLLKLYVYHCN